MPCEWLKGLCHCIFTGWERTANPRRREQTKVICDKIFGRNNSVTNIVWQKGISPDNILRLGSVRDYTLVYTTNKGWDKKFNQLGVNQSRLKNSENPDNDPVDLGLLQI
jgi:adenine-specific DNA-methyltransferase